jgi:exodeoxyribonuclease V alpha subunit
MPGEESLLLSRELFYTSITRAEKRVRIVGGEDAIRAALSHRALRATGLSHRLTN